MNIKDLQNIYPFGQIYPAKQNEKEFLNLPINNDWLVLKKSDLSQTEIDLLTHLFLRVKKEPVNRQHHPWYGFLFDGKPIENVSGAYRIIQFKLTDFPKEFERHEWLHAFSSMFNETIDCFFYDEKMGLLVEKKEKSNYSLEELEGILLTLESDFPCKIKAYLGSFLNISEGFPRFFQEEQKIFIEEAYQIKSKSIFTLSQVALHYFTKDTVKNSLIMQIFSKRISIDGEMKEIIQALWHNQGNISSAAKELFMHRNTLQYRIEKFHEQTGLSLKTMDDLVYSYLLVKQ